jgi:hypothetical protein
MSIQRNTVAIFIANSLLLTWSTPPAAAKGLAAVNVVSFDAGVSSERFCDLNLSQNAISINH